MLPNTTDRVENNTSQALQKAFDNQFRETLDYYRHASRDEIDRRLAELDEEWDIERLIEVEAPLMIGLGAGLGFAHSPRWFGLSAFAAGMVILHNLQGWYPLLPVFQRMGFRSQNEIEQERIALRVLRKDHLAYTRH